MKKILAILLLCLLLTGCARVAAPTATGEFTLPPETEPTKVTEQTEPETEETEPETAPPTAAPETEPPVTEPETVFVPSGPAVVITKHPTGETLSPGGKTWFVAHADNADTLNWEVVAPDGTVYTPLEAMGQNPGLQLDVSKTDTISVENVPASMNGWAFQARFSGPGGSEVTEAARITIRKSEGAYDSILAKYRSAMESDIQGYSGAAEADVSEMIYYASHVGYVCMDLDGNGTEELILAGIGYDIPDVPYLYEIFTLQNNTPVSLFRATIRNRIFLMNDNRFFCEGSGGAFNSFFGVKQLNGSELFFREGLYTDRDPDKAEGILFFYTTSNEYGDPNEAANDTKMDEKIANTLIDNWRNAVTLPNLSLIA